MSKVEWLSNEELIDEIRYRLHKQASIELPENYYDLEEQIRKLSLQLRESEKGKSAFLSNVRNEINNPITSILGLSTSLQDLVPDTKAQNLCRLIHHQVFDLNLQMRNIITAAEIEMGEIRPVFARIDITTFVQTQIDFLTPMLQSKGISVNCNFSESLEFTTDAILLQEVLINVLTNAIEFSGESKVIDVCGTLRGDKLVLEICDYGVGIEPDKQELIFQRFMQGDSGTRKVHRGHGLGLAIALELVDALGGALYVDSTPQVGTQVSLHLIPIAEAPIRSSSTFGNDVIFDSAEEEF